MWVYILSINLGVFGKICQLFLVRNALTLLTQLGVIHVTRELVTL